MFVTREGGGLTSASGEGAEAEAEALVLLPGRSSLGAEFVCTSL